jgi:ABC-2 type transport system permease protein
MPVGVVDLDNTSTTRALIRRLDAFQTSRVVAHYTNPTEARQAIQKNKIYAFLYIPKGTTDDLLSARQPKVSYYYSSVYYTAGALLMRDLKTITTLGSAAVGQATMQARGYTDRQIKTFLQPIAIDLHAVGNPWINYNVYLSTFIIPGILLLFIFLISAYSIGTELKFHRSQELMRLAGNDIYAAMLGKFLPQTLIWLTIFYGYLWYIFGHLNFPHPGGTWLIMLLGLLAVISSQGFGVFIFGLMPSLRMSMSICSLWGVLSFSTCGAAFPLMAMDAPIKALANLFPLRHYFMIYQLNIFNGYPMEIAWFNYMALGIFIVLPLFVMRNIRKAMLEYVYIP